MGAGAAGGWVAKELCERGLSVLALDAGPLLSERDFRQPPPPLRPLQDRARGVLGGQRVQMRAPAFNSRTRSLLVNDRQNPYRGAGFTWIRGRQVGGRMHLWARVALRFGEEELAGWPLSLRDLEPAYERAEDFLAVEPAQPTAAEREFGRRVGGERLAPLPLAAPLDSPVPATVLAARATGNLTLRPDSVVRSVSADGVVSITGRRDRRAATERAERIFLCAGAFDTLRIMLASGIGASSGLLGQGVRDHVVSGIGGPRADDDPVDPEPYSTAGATGLFAPLPQRGFGIQGGIGRGPSWYMLAHGEMEVRPENRVTLHPTRTDAWGAPIAVIDCSHGPRDAAMAAAQQEEMADLARAGGLQVRTPPSGRRRDALAYRLGRRRLLTPSGAFLPGSAIHETGGALMGTDSSSSVLDPQGRCWDAPRIHVCDGAAFPSGGWRNITLTIVALAIRAAQAATD